MTSPTKKFQIAVRLRTSFNVLIYLAARSIPYVQRISVAELLRIQHR
jgi:hypothetical protein